MKTKLTFKVFLPLALMAAFPLIGACSTGTIEREGQPAAQASVPVGNIEVTLAPDIAEVINGDRAFSKDDFIKNVQDQMAERGSFQNGAPGSIEIQLTNFRLRSTGIVVMFGVFAGRDHLEGNVLVKNKAGQVVDTFVVHSKLGAFHAAGTARQSRMDWLYRKFGFTIHNALSGQE